MSFSRRVCSLRQGEKKIEKTFLTAVMFLILWCKAKINKGQKSQALTSFTYVGGDLGALVNKSLMFQLSTAHQMGLPRWSSSKESACQGRRHKTHGFDLWVGKILKRRKWQPTPIFLPGKSHGQRSLAGCSPLSDKESDTTQ